MSVLRSRTFLLAILVTPSTRTDATSDDDDLQGSPERGGECQSAMRVARVVVRADGARWDEDTEPAAPWARTRSDHADP